jgi:hypothetical protein
VENVLLNVSETLGQKSFEFFLHFVFGAKIIYIYISINATVRDVPDTIFPDTGQGKW